MEAKFTKGDWVIRDNGSFFDIGPVGLKYVNPSVCIGVMHKDEANANLIKTAPKLYAMLDKIATTPICAIHVAKDIKKLLAEARGE